jgi:hypothetical protein
LRNRHDPIDNHNHNSRTAFLALSGGVAFFEKETKEELSPARFKGSDLFIIEPKIEYQACLASTSCRFVEGHDVLDSSTRDRLIIMRLIEWDETVKADEVGEVTQAVEDDGDVSERVLREAGLLSDESEEEAVDADDEEDGSGSKNAESLKSKNQPDSDVDSAFDAYDGPIPMSRKKKRSSRPRRS